MAENYGRFDNSWRLTRSFSVLHAQILDAVDDELDGIKQIAMRTYCKE